MKFKTRLILTFGLFSFFLCVLFALLLKESLNALEDQIVTSFLRQEVDFLQERYRENPDLLVIPELDQLKGYLSTDPNLPTWLKVLETGIHETTEYVVLVKDFDSDLRIYLFFDEASGLLDRYEEGLWIILWLLILIVSMIGIGLGIYQANVLAKPVNQLADQVGQVDLENPQITPLENHDEIGFLSRAYAGLINRLGGFIQREKAFTRYASHELKTPLSILNNNLELLRSENSTADMRQRSIDRISMATNQMQRQIEIFLMLSREQKLEPSEHALQWSEMFDDLAVQFPRVSLSLDFAAQPGIFVKPAVVQVILLNVLSNVIKHGESKQDRFEVSVYLNERSLTITNEIPQAEVHAKSNEGFGLEINKKLCEAIGWSFSALQGEGEFVVTMEFN